MTQTNPTWLSFNNGENGRILLAFLVSFQLWSSHCLVIQKLIIIKIIRIKLLVLLMGCSVSKAEDTALVIRCRERKELLRAAADHRYALAAAHVAYFRSLKDVGDALRKFVDEELVFASSSSVSSASSPVITLHSLDDGVDEGGGKHKHTHSTHSDNGEAQHLHSHLDLSSSDSEHTHSSHSDDDDSHRHHHSHVNREGETMSPFAHRDYYWVDPGNDNNQPYPYPYPYPPAAAPEPPQGFWGGGDGGFYGMMNPSFPGWGFQENGGNMNFNMNMNVNTNRNMYYMKKSGSSMRTVVQEPGREGVVANGYSTMYWNGPVDQNGVGGLFGYPMNVSRGGGEKGNGDGKPNAPPGPPPPPSPKASVWDFINPFEAVDNAYQGYYPQAGYGYGSAVSSPDSDEVREREGIPELEEETETEVYKDEPKWKRSSEEFRKSLREGSGSGSGSGSRSVPLHHSEASSKGGSERAARSVPSQKTHGSSMGVPSHLSSEGSSKPVREVPLHKLSDGSSTGMPSRSSEESAMPKSSHFHEDSSLSLSSEDGETPESIHHLTDEKSSSDPTVVKSMDDGHVKKKGVTFEIDETSKNDLDSSKLSSLTTISVHGTRDLREVVAEIRDGFDIASNYGKEVALMLEVGRLPYQPSFAKVVLSRIMYMMAPSKSAAHTRSMQSLKLASKTMKLAKSYFADLGQDISTKHYNLSSTLDELYAWEKKLYKEVKDEERLRLTYEKQRKRLKILDERGAESTKIDAAQDSIRKLLTKLNLSIKAIDAISSRIHKLRDEELQPQVAELIHGLITMWKSMLKCHQKQFQAVMESKIRSLKANTGFQSDSRVRATVELQRELIAWCDRFNDWISTQKSYVESLNGWLLRCLDYKPEETPDGPVPFSPGQLGAPPIFVISNDWNQAMEAISEARVADAMRNFASILEQLWEKQDEEHRQRLKAEYLSKDFKQQISKLQAEWGKMEHDHEEMSDKTGVSIVPSENGVSQLDGLKVDLDSMKKRLAEERTKHKDAVKIVHDAASTSIQGGLVPIFKALESFTSEALKAHEQVRL